MRWFWGLLILSIGVIFLGQNLGLWSNVSAADLLRFWPLILVLFGFTLIVKHLKFGWIIILIAYVAALYLIYYSLTKHMFSFGSINISWFSKFFHR